MASRSGGLYVNSNAPVDFVNGNMHLADDPREDAAYSRLRDAETRLNRLIRRFDGERKVLGYLWMDDLRDVEREVARCVGEFDRLLKTPI
jgi:hypothetical protein